MSFSSGQSFTFFLLLLAIGSLGPLLFLHQEWLIQGQDYSQISSRLSVVRESVAEAHLWAEELITGDATQNVSEVDERFSQAHTAAKIFKDELPSKGAGISSNVVDGMTISEHAIELQVDLVALEDAATARLAARSISHAGSESDISFDSIYKRVLDRTHLLESNLMIRNQELVGKNLRDHYITLLVWAGTLAGTSVVLIVLRIRQRREEADKKALEERFQEAQKLESLGVLAGGIAHDFNNLLQAISGNASLLLDESSLTESVRSQVIEIAGGATKASELTSQMLAYAGKGRMNEFVVKFDQLVSEIGALVRLSTPKTVEVNYSLEADSACIRCNETQVQQVVMNLVINAAEATLDNPKPVSVRTSLQNFTTDQLVDCVATTTEFEEGEYLVFEVEDHGTGMSGETLARCFEPFYSTKFSGRGLGLAAVHGIVRSHGGILMVTSELGVGTTFKALFPRCYDAPDQFEVEETDQQIEGYGRRALVIDDDEMVRKILVRMLIRLGYEVFSAEDGDTGIEAIELSGGNFHVVIIDMEMPGRNGLEVGKVIRSTWEHLPLVLSSGYGREMIKSDGPFQAFIQKPYTLTSMAKTVSAVALPPEVGGRL